MGSPYKALADDTRREILLLLSKKQTSAGEIASKFHISKPAISNHLKILTEADLIKVRNNKQLRLYRLNREMIKEVVNFIDSLLKKSV